MTPVDISIMESDFSQLERLGSPYSYGGKAKDAAGHIASNSELSHIAPRDIVDAGGVDCSGYARWALARATKGKLIIPDGSQNQRAWAQKNLRQVQYRDAAWYMTPNRLFIAFIRPWHNGCGHVGHVWFLSHYDDGNNNTTTGTLESHGGGGCTSRPWSYRTLIREVYNCFELPAKGGQQ